MHLLGDYFCGKFDVFDVRASHKLRIPFVVIALRYALHSGFTSSFAHRVAEELLEFIMILSLPLGLPPRILLTVFLFRAHPWCC